MHSLVIRGSRLRLEERPTPSPGPHDVLVTVAAAGINAADLMQRAGSYPAPPGSPHDVPGLELAGVVTEVGDRVGEPLIGRRVAALVGGGGQSSHCVVAAEHLLFMPEHVEFDQAAGFPEAFSTAYDALVTRGGLRAGERTLISGATGGVGLAAVQIAHRQGAEVVAVTRDDTHHERLRALGADETVTLEEITAIEPVDVVLELLGGSHLSMVQRKLRDFARIVVIGVPLGAHVELDLLRLMRHRATITGSTLRSRSRAEKTAVARAVGDALVPRWNANEIVVPVDRVFALEDAESAYAYFAEPGKFGKVILRVD